MIHVVTRCLSGKEKCPNSLIGDLDVAWVPIKALGVLIENKKVLKIMIVFDMRRNWQTMKLVNNFKFLYLTILEVSLAACRFLLLFVQFY